eukprot:TRINITY_DN1494_c2_g1_i1.p1 TRINITY_DN1494_c2_g1~~TRINITY_DN1494_c2_g1_i1.p1  ORF type:complete len:398 (+),score=102.60 TRINITY_DN1494_c2_g1_i1:65-1195(+)
MSDVETLYEEDKNEPRDVSEVLGEITIRPPDPVPFQRKINSGLKHFKSSKIHCVRVVEKVETRVLQSFFPGTPERVLVVSPNSLLLCDLGGPLKRLIRLSAISQIMTQKIPRKKGEQPILHLLIKVPTDQDLLLALIDHKFNDSFAPSPIDTIRKTWSVDRFERKGDVMKLPIFEVPDGERIFDSHLRVQEEDKAAGKKCKFCLAKNKELEAFQEQLMKVFNNSLEMEQKTRETAKMKEAVATFRRMSREANLGREMFKKQSKDLIACVDRLQQELDEWKEFAETLVKQTQILNVPSEISNLCSPQRVAVLERRLDQAEHYRKAYADLYAKYENREIEDEPSPEASLSSSSPSLSHAALQSLQKMQQEVTKKANKP